VDVAAALRQARRAAGLTQRQLARHVQVSATSLSRYESGAHLPSLPMLDRLLAGCGKDVRLVVVDRVDDHEAEFARRARLPLQVRARGAEYLRPSFLERLVEVGSGVAIGGSWAAELHGIPAEQAPGRLLLADDADLFVRLASAFMRGSVPWRCTDGHYGSLPVRPETFAQHPVAQWRQRDVGAFTTEVLTAGSWPLTRPVAVGAGPLLVVAPQELTEDDGVPAQLLAAWSTWRAGAGPDTSPWRAT
jgi:transcriptional regulator with XRE-family HTH domain